MRTRDILLSTLRECIRLDRETGHLYWVERPRSHFITDQSHATFNKHKAGKRADLGAYATRDYLRVRGKIDGAVVDMLAHRVVFAFIHGKWPTHEIDHIDRVRTNNRPSNLRDVPHRVNMRNRAVSVPRPEAAATA